MSTYPRAALMVRGGPEDGRLIFLSGEIVGLGRVSGNAIVVQESKVSRQHAVIRRDRGMFWIKDLGSKNGTFINGVKIAAEPHSLQNGDRIELGGVDSDIQWVFVGSRETVG